MEKQVTMSNTQPMLLLLAWFHPRFFIIVSKTSIVTIDAGLILFIAGSDTAWFLWRLISSIADIPPTSGHSRSKPESGPLQSAVTAIYSIVRVQLTAWWMAPHQLRHINKGWWYVRDGFIEYPVCHVWLSRWSLGHKGEWGLRCPFPRYFCIQALLGHRKSDI